MRNPRSPSGPLAVARKSRRLVICPGTLTQIDAARKAKSNSFAWYAGNFNARLHFDTLDLASRGIAVRIDHVKGQRRYIVTGTTNHMSAYEIARKLAPVDAGE